MNKQTSLFEIIIASVAITGTLFLLHRLTRQNTMYAPGGAGFNLSVQQNRQTKPVKVDVVDEKPCYFPNDMLIEYDQDNHWGQLNPGAPDIPGNRF